MKQGRADRSGPESRKPEPKPMALSPKGVSQIGTAVDPKAVEAIHRGQGYMGPTPQPQRQGPGGGRTIHDCGSQGKH
jgi:hypothetical protein